MKASKLPIQDAWLIDCAPHNDKRGSFMRLFCQETLNSFGIEFTCLQSNISVSPQRATLRGLHYQKPPKQEAKLVHCLQGKVYDVMVDLRINSSTYKQTFAINLSADKPQFIYVPKGCAHGFITMVDDCSVLYFVDEAYSQADEAGIKWDDSKFNIDWPITPRHISDKDKQYKPYDDERDGLA